MTHTHAPGKPLVNWFTLWFKIPTYRPLCGSLPGGDTVEDDARKATCPACRRALQRAAEEL